MKNFKCTVGLLGLASMMTLSGCNQNKVEDTHKLTIAIEALQQEMNDAELLIDQLQQENENLRNEVEKLKKKTISN